jgi:Phosphotransferase enzyme family
MPALEALPETERNRLLRRADWRFLLPGPRPATAVCFTNGRLAQAVALICDHVFEPGQRLGSECDLAVAVNPDRATLGAAWASLRPGGACYTEWYSRQAGGPPGVRRRLEAAGFSKITCYWPWPWTQREPPMFWLPLEAPGALRYFLATRPQPPSPWGRALNGILQALWRLGRRARLLLPICVVARRPKDLDRPAEASLLDTLPERWSAWGLGPIPERISWLLLTGGLRSNNRVVGLVFAGSDARPRLVVKRPRLPESAMALAQEAAVLQAVEANRPGGIEGVPRVIFFYDGAGQTALGETVLTGEPLLRRVRRDNYRDRALKMTAWLADLAGRAPARPRAEWWQRLVEATLTDFEQYFGPILDPDRLRETRAILATLGDLPLVCEHRDCSPWNVLIAPDGKLLVLDWESAEPRGLPALDLIYFLTYLAFLLDGAIETGRYSESYRAALDPATFTGGVLAECQRQYLTLVGFDPAALRPLRLLVWLIHSLSEYRQFAADSAGRPTLDQLRSSLFVRLWEEELRRGSEFLSRVGPRGEV